MTLHPTFAYRFNHFLVSGLDLFFPPSCGGCGKLGVRWCKDCQQKLEPVPLPVCDICGSSQTKTGLCRDCQNTRPRYSIMRSCTVYKDPARAALLNLKYHHTRWLGEALAWDLALFVNGLGWKADYVVPIPLSKQRTSERGYNQVDLIAHPLAQIMGWPYLTTALQRARHTSSQVGLGRAQRRSNVQGAFVAIAPEIRAKTILLVDDTSTTGSTLDSAAGALIDAGAREVKALTFARALPGHGSDFEKFSPSHSILE